MFVERVLVISELILSIICLRFNDFHINVLAYYPHTNDAICFISFVGCLHGNTFSLARLDQTA